MSVASGSGTGGPAEQPAAGHGDDREAEAEAERRWIKAAKDGKYPELLRLLRARPRLLHFRGAHAVGNEVGNTALHWRVPSCRSSSAPLTVPVCSPSCGRGFS